MGGRGAKYLRGSGPLELVFEKQIGPRPMALSVERRIKRLPRELKEALILGDRPFDEIVGFDRRPARQPAFNRVDHPLPQVSRICPPHAPPRPCCLKHRLA